MRPDDHDLDDEIRSNLAINTRERIERGEDRIAERGEEHVVAAREHREGPGKATELGAVEYFRKPFRPDALVQTIRRHLDAASAVAG